MTTGIKYDRQDVVQKATNLFWRKGYHATSMRNLQEAVDLRPGSIYAGFGSKEGLFRETLQHYTRESLAALDALSAAGNSPLQALQAFVTKAVTTGETEAPSNMCMLVKTMSELTDDNAALLAEAQRLLASIESAFSNLFSQAQSRGELDASKDPKKLASLLQVQVMGLRAYARSNKKANVEALVADAFSTLL